MLLETLCSIQQQQHRKDVLQAADAQAAKRLKLFFGKVKPPESVLRVNIFCSRKSPSKPLPALKETAFFLLRMSVSLTHEVQQIFYRSAKNAKLYLPDITSL